MVNLELIDEIIAKNVTITDQSLYEGVFSAVLEAIDNENEACAKVCESEAAKLGQSREALAIGICTAAIRARREG